MCGICGIINFNGKPISRNLIQQMNNTLIHRGPDDEGYYFNQQKIANSGQRIGDRPSVALAHRRLSIIDLDTGHQPMSNEDGTVWIVFNGEIYNFIKLREKLIKKGHQFRTKSDTEVIIHTYEEYGIDCLNHFNGMFAFALWDEKNNMLFLARDRLGIKPLYYSVLPNEFIFASEIKAILKHPKIQKEIDWKALSDYLFYQYIPSPKTIFTQVKKLPPAHFILIKKDRQIEIESYWDLKWEPDYSLTKQECIDETRRLLLQVVEDRLVSDVPFGAFLSGGVDSSAVVSAMAKIMNIPIKTFTIGFKESDFDEAYYGRILAKHLNTEHYEEIVKPNAIEILPELAHKFDEPFADSSAIPTYYVAKLARKHVTMVLSGDGGDEGFAGYVRYLQALKEQTLFDKKYPFLKKLSRLILSFYPQNLRGRGSLERILETPIQRYFGSTSIFNSIQIQNFLSPEIRKYLNDYRSEYFLKKFYKENKFPDLISALQYLDIKTYLPEDILVKIDRATMANFLESRVPLLDHRLLEFLARVPVNYKIDGKTSKWILREAIKDWLPPRFLDRPKHGFAVPLAYWFRNNLGQFVKDRILGKRFLRRGFFHKDFIKKIIEEHQKGIRDWASRIWSLLIFDEWCRIWWD